jgi:hypothetical protein
MKATVEQLRENYSSVFWRINSLKERLNIRLFEKLKAGYKLNPAGGEIGRAHV